MFGRSRKSAIKKKYDACRNKGDNAACLFARVELDRDLDQWQIRRQNLLFHWPGDNLEPFEVRFTLDANDVQPIAFDWLFTAELPPTLEDRTHNRQVNRVSVSVMAMPFRAGGMK